MSLENIGNPDISEKELKTEITAEDIRELVLPEKDLKYYGKGDSSYSQEYDKQKCDYLEETWGIKIDGSEIDDPNDNRTYTKHAEIVTTYIVVKYIPTLKRIEQRGGDLEGMLEFVNNILKERIDAFGWRKVLGDGTTPEINLKKDGRSANPRGLVSEEEYSDILNNILNSLRTA
ncbi:MAG: hypothetical protein ACOX6Q_02680 [Candidatus Dojkabacteria bacterium]|jgi:hypothetical protein